MGRLAEQGAKIPEGIKADLLRGSAAQALLEDWVLALKRRWFTGNNSVKFLVPSQTAEVLHQAVPSLHLWMSDE